MADTWTDTPTPSNTATSTLIPTATKTPNATATLIAFRPQTNDDWIPVEQDFELPQGGIVTMVLVPTGCFMMGSIASNSDGDEQPVHEICFDEPFWIDKYEVSNEQYGSVGCEQTSPGPNQPRNCVNWFETRNFCEARGSRLPTEAEWEYAARGPDSLVYPWGNTYDATFVISKDDPVYGDISTAPVGSRTEGASWVGAMELSGNLWEWTSSLRLDYPYGDNHEDNTDTVSVRVLRGGSFFNASGDLRSAERGRWNPNNTLNIFGFRCVRDYEIP